MGSCWHFLFQTFKTHIFAAQVWSVLSNLGGNQLCWERQKRCEVHETAHSKDKHSLLFSHTFHRAMIVEQILLNAEWWISATDFQLGDIWGRVSRVQCSWPSGRVVSSAFLPSALQFVKEQNWPRSKLFQKFLLTSAVGTYTRAFLR